MTDVHQDPPTDEVPVGSDPPFDGDFEDMPAPRPRRRRWLTVTAVLMVVLLLVGLAGFMSVRREISPSGRGEDVQVTVPEGSSTGQIAKVLATKGVIGNSTIFTTYVRLKSAGSFQAGEYTLRRHESYNDIISVLTKGPEVTIRKITIPEGFTLNQIAARVGKLPGRDAQKFLAAASSGQVRSSLEPAGSNNL